MQGKEIRILGDKIIVNAEFIELEEGQPEIIYKQINEEKKEVC